MLIKRRVGVLLSGTVLGASVLFAAPAFADDAQTEQLQKQINALQKQLQALQSQVTETKKQAKAAQDQAAQQAAQIAQQPSAPAGLYNAAPPPGPMIGKAPSWVSGIKVSFAGSFIEGATVWRERNEISSGASDPAFSSLPFSNSPLYTENEWRASAQQSRIAIKMTGDIDPAQHMKAYFETDFLGAGVTANSRESNSYNLRMRQAFLEYDNDNYHFHVAAGQAWSLLTQNRVGMLPQTENTPLTIDAQYVAGFNWARQEQLRFVEDWNKTWWFGFSVESPQVNFPSNSVGVLGGPSQGGTSGGLTGTTNVGSPIPPGLAINSLNVCNNSGLLDSATACSNDIAPDFIEKIAVDPGWGHYEVFGLQRFFADQVATTAVPNSWSTKTSFGWGVGGSVLLPVLPKYLDLQGSVMTGQGTGRYGSSQLADVTIGPNGALAPLQTLQFLVGGVGHPWEGLDVYAYYGQEEVKPNFWNIGATHGGYGNPASTNNGCLNENLGSGPAGFNDPIAGFTCTANVQRTQEFTIGFWQNIYKGDVGRFTFGAQYEFVKLTAFPGLATGAGTPNQGLSPYNNIVFTSIRYYPF
jgi:outer membrane murein-binding lipoprotein Lpp